MTITGSSTPSGSPDYNLNYDNPNANAQHAKLGLVIDSTLIIQLFTQVDQDTRYNYKTNFLYPPKMPIGVTGLAQLPSRVSDDWKKITKEIFDELPTDIQNLLLNEKDQPNSLVMLSKLIIGTAVVINWLNNTSYALDPQNPSLGPDSEIILRKEINLSVANMAMRGLQSEANQILGTLKNQLLTERNSNPNFDKQIGFINDLEKAFTSLAEDF